MPQSKKNKVVSLTKVAPKTREHKEFIVNKVHTFMGRFKYVYVLSFDNMSTNNFKSLRESLTDSKFLMGKNKVMGVAFGTSEENSYKPNSYMVNEVHASIFRISKATALSSSPTKTNKNAKKYSATSKRQSSQPEEPSPHEPSS